MTKKLDRPARLQVDPESIIADDKPPQTGNIFNVWFLRWSGGDGSKTYTKSKFRVSIKKDSGYTKAKDSGSFSGRNTTPVCLFFARGCCYLGKKCKYLHRLPSESDYFLPTQDCFGRDRTTNYHDDMGGVGTFTRNTTLYVGNLHMNNTMENTLTKHFQEFGPIEKIRVLQGKNCAFLTYKCEAQAQFAKEAMQNQSLDDQEVIVVKWANIDPDPKAREETKRKLEQMAIDTIQEVLERVEKKAKLDLEASEEPTVEEPEESEEEPQPAQVAQIEAPSMFNSASLQKLASLNLPKSNKAQQMLAGYSSSDEE